MCTANVYGARRDIQCFLDSSFSYVCLIGSFLVGHFPRLDREKERERERERGEEQRSDLWGTSRRRKPGRNREER